MSIYQGNTTCYFLIQAIFSDFFLDPNPDPDPGESQDFGPGPGGVPKWRVSNNLKTDAYCSNETCKILTVPLITFYAPLESFYKHTYPVQHHHSLVIMNEVDK